MGMWDKDKQYGNNAEQALGIATPFVILGASILPDKIDTKLGEADVAELHVQRIGRDGFAAGSDFLVTSVASAIVAKVGEAADDDFPAIVELRRVRSKQYGTAALVLQFVSPYYTPDGEIRVAPDGSTSRGEGPAE
jgi:hypothetical protein